jgi:hypothetical protein
MNTLFSITQTYHALKPSLLSGVGGIMDSWRRSVDDHGSGGGHVGTRRWTFSALINTLNTDTVSPYHRRCDLTERGRLGLVHGRRQPLSHGVYWSMTGSQLLHTAIFFLPASGIVESSVSGADCSGNQSILIPHCGGIRTGPFCDSRGGQHGCQQLQQQGNQLTLSWHRTTSLVNNGNSWSWCIRCLSIMNSWSWSIRSLSIKAGATALV